MEYDYSYRLPLQKEGYICTKHTWAVDSKVIFVSDSNEHISVYFDAYPNCCGSLVMFELDFLYRYKEKAIEMMKSVIRCAFNDNRNHITYISLAFLQEAVNEVLKEVGFREVDRFRNANTGNICILWSLNPTK